jgi:hypothetical protein
VLFACAVRTAQLTLSHSITLDHTQVKLVLKHNRFWVETADMAVSVASDE